MNEILKKLEKVIEMKLGDMSNCRGGQRPTADEIYKMACAIKMCDEVKGNELLRENEIKAGATIEKMIADFHNGRGLK